MTASEFQRPARVISSSPKLKNLRNYNPSYNKEKMKNQKSMHCPASSKDMQNDTKGTVMPVKLTKKSQVDLSPYTCRNEGTSPKSIFWSSRSPVQQSLSQVSCIMTHTCTDMSSSPSENMCMGNMLAVPKVSVEPPSPSLLPNPPKHWVRENSQKHQCTEVTNCLMTHLASSGILVSAQ